MISTDLLIEARNALASSGEQFNHVVQKIDSYLSNRSSIDPGAFSALKKVIERGRNISIDEYKTAISAIKNFENL